MKLGHNSKCWNTYFQEILALYLNCFFSHAPATLVIPSLFVIKVTVSLSVLSIFVTLLFSHYLYYDIKSLLTF